MCPKTIDIVSRKGNPEIGLTKTAALTKGLHDESEIGVVCGIVQLSTECCSHRLNDYVCLMSEDLMFIKWGKVCQCNIVLFVQY
jgi:hypothetical protein